MTGRINLIIFGATGYTGQLVIEDVHKISKTDESITWAIAGRSQLKLEQIIKELENKTGDDLSKIKIFIADTNDQDSLEAMTRKADVLINCCGPYRFHGEPVVKACVATKTNHVDCSGEPAYMEKMQLKYHEAAKKAGIYIVSACGFDSIPADMGVVFLEQNFKGIVNSVESYFRAFAAPGVKTLKGSAINYATWVSLINGIAHSKELGPLRRQLYPERLPKFSPKLLRRSVIHKSNIDQGWFLPFPGSDTAVVQRTQRYMYDRENKRPIQMAAYAGFPTLFSTLNAVLCGIIVGSMARYSCGRKLLLKYPKLFTFGFISNEGPLEESRKDTRFSVTLYGEGWDESTKNVDNEPINKRIKVKISGTDPAYGAASIALVYSAIAILKESDKMPETGGVLAPGAAFANTSLIQNMCKHNFKFEIVECEKDFHLKSKL